MPQETPPDVTDCTTTQEETESDEDVNWTSDQMSMLGQWLKEG